MALAAAAITVLTSAKSLAEPIVFKDMTGRQVHLDKPADRVSSLVIPLASTVIAIEGNPSKLSGMNLSAKKAIEEGILGRIFPDAKTIPSDIAGANFVPNVEALAATRPDLVIQWGDLGNDVVQPIVNAGMNAMLVLYGTEEKGREFLQKTATALGRPDRIAPLVAWRQDVQKDIESRLAAVPIEKRPSVLYLARVLSGLQAAGEGPADYTAFTISLAGGRHAAKGLTSTKPVDREQVAAWDPEVILLTSFEPQLSVDDIYKDPILSLTKAARNKRVYKLPLGGYRWDPPNQESPLTWMWLANLLHPDVFKYDLRSEMARAYKSLYNYDLTDADTDEILRIGMQAGSTNYAQFRAR
ncbi:ABC transporter substrate-binding protein (plasmid) [Microvirga sp. VF16]|nr:ABC transporter substrate-binding protein [Microvirga sp. VF16]